jgi:YgiT-type zinc finger domain-containing protein
MERRLQGEEAMSRCERCDQGERRPALRARLAERDGRTALVLNVPVEVCPACGQVWLTMPVAKRLDELFDRLLASGAESAQMHWDQAAAA